MSTIIKNYQSLASSSRRAEALAIAEAGLRAIDTKTVLENNVGITDTSLVISGQHFTLSDYKHIYVIGFGKVSCTAAFTLETILANRIKDGAVIGVAETVCNIVETYAGTHPLPSQHNYTATKHIEEVARNATADDLVIVIVSGGGSALLCSSMGECDQGIKLFSSFMQSGGTIEELNIVRKHISGLKGGGLAKALFPATVASLIFSDVPGGDITAVASGPTCFDPTTVDDAQKLIDTYNLGKFMLIETPKDPKYFERVHNINVVSNLTALNAMQKTADELGYRASLVSATQYVTPEETTKLFLREVDQGDVYCMGGETKVAVPDGCIGKGGRNGHLALSVLPSLQPGQVFVSLASDGHDNSDVAGALVDQETILKAQAAQLDLKEYTECLNSYPFFEHVGGHIVTGMLESNVADLMFLLTPKRELVEAPITDVVAKVLPDSRGKDTIEVTITAGAFQGSFAVPSGASTGIHEVSVLPAKQAVKMIKSIIEPKLLGVNVIDQTHIDDVLRRLGEDPQFSKIGGNTALGVSVAACKAAAAAQGIETWHHIASLFDYHEQAPAPRLVVNAINGGKHATQGSSIQEHQIIPDTDDPVIAFETAKAVMRSLEEVLVSVYGQTAVWRGDEGGFTIPSTTLDEPFQHIVTAIRRTHCQVPVLLGADMAASSFYKDGLYEIGGQKLTADELLAQYTSLHEKFPMLQLVEDPFAEDDMAGFTKYHDVHPGVLTIGDDLTTTNKIQLQKAIEAEAVSALIIKPNQIGTVTDTLETMRLAYKSKVWCIVSHRSGETMDDFIADLAFGTKAFGLKAGAPSAPERAAKYNRLLKICK